MGLKDKIDSLYVGFFGNRVTTVGTALYVNHLTSLLYFEEHPVPATISLAGGFIGATVLWGVSVFGINTWKHYKRTLKEAKEKGKINFTFFEEKIKKNGCNRYLGYCEIQGIYLGAKKTGNLETFYAAREMFSNNIIPNF